MGKSTGGAYLPNADYTRTGATDTGGTYASATLTSPTLSGATAIGAGATLTTPTLTNPTVTTGTFASPVVTGDAAGGVVIGKTVAFVENGSSTTYTGTVVVPAGATLLDIYVFSTALWTASDSAMVVGDANSANGWFTTFQLDTTDLVVGERLQASNANNWGGVNGAYLTTAGRFGQQSGNMIGGYCPTAYSVIGVATKSGAGTAGRTFMTVTYVVGQASTSTNT